MATMVLNNDLTNAHHVDVEACRRLAIGCRVMLVVGHEAQAIYKLTRPSHLGDERWITCHVVTSIPSDADQVMTEAVRATEQREVPTIG